MYQCKLLKIEKALLSVQLIEISLSAVHLSKLFNDFMDI